MEQCNVKQVKAEQYMWIEVCYQGDVPPKPGPSADHSRPGASGTAVCKKYHDRSRDCRRNYFNSSIFSTAWLLPWLI